MNSHALITPENGLEFFFFERLFELSQLSKFDCSDSACTMARECNKKYMACRFLTVDADVEHNAGVLDFYKKNRFLVNEELYNKNRKTISMRKDIYS